MSTGGAATRTLRVVVAGGVASSLSSSLGQATRGVRNLGDAAAREGGRLRGKFSGLGRSLGGVFAAGLGAAGIVGIASFVKESTDSLQRIERLNAQTATAIKSTGAAAGVTAEHIEDLTGALENSTATEAESIQTGANLLLTFTNVKNEAGKGNDVFDQTTMIMNDMARAMDKTGGANIDMSGTAIQLGKALNDPIKGITALSKVGVSFSDEQKKTIKTMVEAGNTMGAQKIILAELNKEFGGSGAAFAQTTAGKVELAKHAIGTFGETITTFLLPPLGKLATIAADGLNKAAEEFPGFVDKVKKRLAFLDPVIAGAKKKIGNLKGSLSAGIAAFKAGDGDITSSGIAGVFERIGFVARKVFDTLGPMFKKAVAVLGPIVSRVGAAIGPALQKAMAVIGPIITKVFDAIRPVLAKVMPMLERFADFFMKEIFPVLVEVGKAILEHFVSKAILIFDALKEILPVLWDFVKTLAANLFPVLKDLAGILVHDVMPMIQELIRNLVAALIPIIKTVIEVFKALIPPIFEVAKVFIHDILPVIMQVVGTLVRALMPVLQTLAKLIAQVLKQAIAALLPALQNLAKMFNEHKDQITRLVQIVGGFVAALLKIVGVIIEKLAPIISWLINVLIKNMITQFKIVIAVIGFVLDAFFAVGEGIGKAMWIIYSTVAKVIGWIKTAFSTGMDIVKTTVSTAFGILKTVFWTPMKWIYDKIVWLVGKIGDWIGKIPNFFSGIWDGLVDGFATVINGMIDIYNSTVANIPGVDEIEHVEMSKSSQANAQFNEVKKKWEANHPGQKMTKDQEDRLRASTNKMFGLANGGIVTRAGQVLVGERGPEILSTPKGASVIPLDRAGAPSSAQPVIVQLTVHGSVLTEGDLVDAIYKGLLKKQGRNGGRLGLA